MHFVIQGIRNYTAYVFDDMMYKELPGVGLVKDFCNKWADVPGAIVNWCWGAMAGLHLTDNIIVAILYSGAVECDYSWIKWFDSSAV